MAGENPDATCTLSPSGTVTTVLVGAKCKVTYEFNTAATSAGLALPYVVAINGLVLPEYAKKPGALSKDNRKISIVVNPGSKIALFLNSDVHPDHRKNPLYAVQVGNNDVRVKITERTGRIGHAWSTLGQPVCRSTATPGKRLDVYQASLTGNIWMEISHLYTPTEADALLPPDTAPAIRDAVRRIYAGLPSPQLTVIFPASDAGPKLTFTVKFLAEMQANVLANTTHCAWLTGILPRTHPHAFVALLTEAHAAHVTEVRVTSGWRPCMGSIAHRAGLGLDINYAESGTHRIALNRASLTDSRAAPNGNVSARERALHADYAKAHDEEKKSTTSRDNAKAALAKTSDPNERSRLQQVVAADEDKLKASQIIVNRASKLWMDELKQNEPGLIRDLRNGLGSNKSIKQVFDPWYMDHNTQDAVPPDSNAQFTPNERLHKNHLHITVLEPEILP